MPQMSPIWWELMMIMFTMLYLLINFLVYYNYLPTNPSKDLSGGNSVQINWKW